MQYPFGGDNLAADVPMPIASNSEYGERSTPIRSVTGEKRPLPPPPPPPPPPVQPNDAMAALYARQRHVQDAQEEDQRVQHAARMHGQFGPTLIEMYGSRRREIGKLLLAALTFALGLSLFWFAKRMFKDVVFVESCRDQWTTQQRVLAHASLPMSIVALIWTVKVFWTAGR